MTAQGQRKYKGKDQEFDPYSTKQPERPFETSYGKAFCGTFDDRQVVDRKQVGKSSSSFNWN